MKNNIVSKTKESVRQGYSQIAEDFARTRRDNWDVLKKYRLSHVQKDDRILDLGCGSGRLVSLFASLDIPLQYVGLDYVPEFLDIAQKQYGGKYKKISCFWQEGDMSELPFEDASFHQLYAVASLQHIPSRRARKEVVLEMSRILISGGTLVMTNWDLWTALAFKKFRLLRQMFFNPFRGYEKGDFLIPWRDSKRDIVTNRYYHAFTKEELLNLFSDKDVWEIEVLDTVFVNEKRKKGSIAKSFVLIVRKK